MITDERRLRRYCKEFQKIENYQEAVQSTELYVLHHRKGIETLDDGTVVRRSRKELKELGLYWNRPAEELILLKHTDHTTMHGTGRKLSVESIEKMSAAEKGKRVGDKNPMFGRTGDKSHLWKGDLASDHAKYMRLRKQKKREATEDPGTSSSD